MRIPGNSGSTVLGLDIGVQSVGWALLRGDGAEDVFGGLVGAGVRVFEAGVEGDVASGKDESRAAPRRQARLARRQFARRAQRSRRLYALLQEGGLLPAGGGRSGLEIHDALTKLDERLRSRWVADGGDRVGAHVWPYRLRWVGLDKPLSREELGRALFHLGQRRGFRSNRLTDADPKEDKEQGQVKAGIEQLGREMEAAGARTLGEFFAGLDPEATRIRKRWTARSMYEDEFSKLWSAQAAHHPEVLTEAYRKRVHRAMFFQRPLKSQSGLIGACELYAGRKRAAIALPVAQRFRMLQGLNNLRILEPDGRERGLSAQERATALSLLEQGDCTFNDLRKALGLKKPAQRQDKKTGEVRETPGYLFNLELGGDTRLMGNRTGEKLRAVFGGRWDSLRAAERSEVVDLLLCVETPEAMAKIGRRKYGLSEEDAWKLAQVRLEQDRARFSRQALADLVAGMEDGTAYMTVMQGLGGVGTVREPVELLEKVQTAVKGLRNPAVERALTQVRRVVNAVIRRWGKPDMIRIELARDLKRPRKEREQATKRMRDREKERQAASRQIAESGLGIDSRNRDAILKILLAEECGWTCPYTGRAIDMQSLLGPSPAFDIEHIIPRSRCLDDSFMNKTLCEANFNRSRKGDRTPWEAFHGDAEAYAGMLERVRRFGGGAAREKLARFSMNTEEVQERFGDFNSRQLNDTRYASKLAAEYVGQLYGGTVDAQGRRRVQTNTGEVTAKLRDAWGLNGLLNQGESFKTRDDHRHHAVDAVVVGLCGPGMVKRYAEASAHAPRHRSRLVVEVDTPWAGFVDEVRSVLNGMVVSHRRSRKVSGALHAETNYSPPRARQGEEVDASVRHVRKPLVAMSRGEIEAIVDPVVKRLVLEKLGGGDPGTVFADAANLPLMYTTRDGLAIPIRKARYRKRVTPLRVGGKRGAERHVAPGSNHHMAIVAKIGLDGKEASWEGHVVTMFEAARRLRAGEPVVQRDWGAGRRFVFSVSGGDCLEVDTKFGKGTLVRVTVISGNQIECRLINDARPMTVLRTLQGERIRLGVDASRKSHARKVLLGVLGEVYQCND